MSWLRAVWRIATNFFATAVLLALYHRFIAPFEVTVISLLGLLYVTSIGQRLEFLMLFKETAGDLERRFASVMRLIDREVGAARLKEIQAAERQIDAKFLVPTLIESLFVALIFFICAYKLVSVALF